MNAQTQEKDEPGEATGAGEFYVVAATSGTWYVGPATAARLGAMLDRRLRPRWMKFVDVYGARVWLRADTVDAVYESSEPIRSRSRAFHHHWQKEERSDRRWESED